MGRLEKSIKKTLLIGSCESSSYSYEYILSDTKIDTIQLGDFGDKSDHMWHLENINSDKNKILFGDKDDSEYLHSAHSLGNYGMYNGIFFIRGAKPQISFGSDRNSKELSYYDMQQCAISFGINKPSVVIAHDCPFSVYHHFTDNPKITSTNKFLDRLFEIHKPSMFIFTHHNISKEITISGTTYKCLSKLERFEIGTRKF